VRLDEVAVAFDVRAGECAALVTEQLRPDELARNAAAVDRHVTPGRAPRPLVNHAREQVLAGPGLADDQHVAVGLRRAQRLLDRRAKRRIVSAHRCERALLVVARSRHRDERRSPDRQVRTDAQLRTFDEVTVDARPVPRPPVPHQQRAARTSFEDAVHVADVRILEHEVTTGSRPHHPSPLGGRQRVHLRVSRWP